MKVLMIGNNPKVKGGITTVISQLMEHDWEQEDIHMKFLPTYVDKNAILKLMYFAVAYIKIMWQMIINKPDVAHIHMSYKGSFTRKYMIHKLCRCFKVKDVIHLHGSEFKMWYDNNPNKQSKIRRLLREASAFIVLGDEWAKRISDIEPSTNIIIVNNTVAIPDSKTQWSKNPFKVLFLGVLIQRKGVSDLLDAINLLKKEIPLDNVEFDIAGSGQEESNLREKCTGLKLDDCVKFLGWTDGDKKVELLKDSQLMVLPSYNEGLPMAVLEAMSYGLPIVATNVGDIPLVVKEGINGGIINPGDITGLKDALKKIICLGKEDWQLYSNRSREIIESSFNDKNYYGQIAKAYRESK